MLENNKGLTGERTAAECGVKFISLLVLILKVKHRRTYGVTEDSPKFPRSPICAASTQRVLHILPAIQDLNFVVFHFCNLTLSDQKVGGGHFLK